MAKKEEQITSETISSEIQKYVEEIGVLRDEYKSYFEAMKKIEKEITIKAGAISALKVLVDANDTGNIENTEGEGI